MSEVPPLADTHCHLCLPDFEDDLPSILARSRAAGVRRILVPGIDLETSRRAVQLASAHEEIYAAVGVHPHNASGYTPRVRRSLLQMASEPKVVAIGEIGLDFYRNRSSREDQERAFDDQLELASEVSLPVVIHNREATAAVLERILPWASSRRRAGVLHAFSSDAESARAAATAGWYFGIAGPITYAKAETARDVAGQLPHATVLTETDAPYLTPHPFRGHRNEPAHVALVAEALSDLWHSPLPETRQVAWENADSLFQWTHGTQDHYLL